MARLPGQCKFGCLVSVSFADRTERRSCDSCDCDELRNQIEVRDAGQGSFISVHFLDWKASVDEKVRSSLSPKVMLLTSEVPQIFAVRQIFQKIGGQLGLVWLSSFLKANSVDVNSKSMPDECANSSFASEVPAPTRKLDRFTSRLTNRFERMLSETSSA